MRFSVRTPSDAIRAKLRRAKVAFGDQQRPALEAMGVAVLSQSQQAYRVKSRGGQGSDGIRWEPLADSTLAKRNRRGRANANRKTTKSGKARPIGGSVSIGIDTGLQLSSASPGFNASGGGNIFRLTSTDITVGYGRSYSKYFDDARPLLPVKLPQAWRKILENIVSRWAASLIKGSLK